MNITENAEFNPEGDPEKPGVQSGGYARAVFDGAREGISDLIFTYLLYASLIVACLLPVLGAVVAAVFILTRFRRGGSLFLPILSFVASIFWWIIFRSPLGMLPLVLDIIG